MLNKSKKGDLLSGSLFEDDFNEDQVSIERTRKSKRNKKSATKLTEQEKSERKQKKNEKKYEK